MKKVSYLIYLKNINLNMLCIFFETHGIGIYSPINFLKNNVEATLNLLEVSNDYYKNLGNKKKFIQVFAYINR